MMRIEIPKLRLWHLLGFVAVGAAFLSVMQFRWSVFEPGYSEIRQLRALDPSEREKAASRLGVLRTSDRRAIAPLAEALFDTDARVRAAAALSLSMIVHDDKDPEFGFVKAALTSASATANWTPAGRSLSRSEISIPNRGWSSRS